MKLKFVISRSRMIHNYNRVRVIIRIFIRHFVDVGEWEPEGSGESGTRVWCPDLQHEGQWHHLVLVLNRAVLKNSSFSLYLDG